LIHVKVQRVIGERIVSSENTVEHRYVMSEGLIERMDVYHWTIRNATADDIPFVLGLWAAAGSPPSVTDSLDGLARLLAADPGLAGQASRRRGSSGLVVPKQSRQALSCLEDCTLSGGRHAADKELCLVGFRCRKSQWVSPTLLVHVASAV
jgi:hypothetical protein